MKNKAGEAHTVEGHRCLRSSRSCPTSINKNLSQSLKFKSVIRHIFDQSETLKTYNGSTWSRDSRVLSTFQVNPNLPLYGSFTGAWKQMEFRTRLRTTKFWIDLFKAPYWELFLFKTLYTSGKKLIWNSTAISYIMSNLTVLPRKQISSLKKPLFMRGEVNPNLD